jgi:hypothetical protein
VNLKPPDGELRYRPKRGEPRCLVEHVAQWAWRWRIELVLAEIALSVGVAILVEFLRT